MKNHFIKYGLVIIGTMIAAFGVTLIIKAGIGADPISTFLLGCLKFVHIKFGTASQLFCVTLLVLNLLLDRKNIGLGSIIYGVGCGFFINMFMPLDLSVMAMIPNVFIVLIGVILLGAGIALYLCTKTGAGPLEGLMVFFAEKTNFSIKATRIGLDALLVVIGIILGGQFGVGTLIGVFLTGPTIELTLKMLNKVRVFSF
ncbi:YitT family protein [Microbacteriaceae bacterium 4G12]